MARARTPLTLDDVDGLDWSRGQDGLLPAIAQDADTLQVLMLAWMDPAALRETLENGEATFHSRSRGGRWRKGETSGHRLLVQRVLTDCDGDAILLNVRPQGPACHENTTSCFGAEDAPGLGTLARLEQTIASRADADPAESWTARLLGGDIRRIAQKVGEEGVETALAGAAGSDAELREEAADLIYHLLVLLRARGVALAEVISTLGARSCKEGSAKSVSAGS